MYIHKILVFGQDIHNERGSSNSSVIMPSLLVYANGRNMQRAYSTAVTLIANLERDEQDVPLIAPDVVDRDHARDGGEQRGQHSDLRRQIASTEVSSVVQKSERSKICLTGESQHLVNPVEVELLAQGYVEKR